MLIGNTYLIRCGLFRYEPLLAKNHSFCHTSVPACVAQVPHASSCRIACLDLDHSLDIASAGYDVRLICRYQHPKSVAPELLFNDLVMSEAAVTVADVDILGEAGWFEPAPQRVQSVHYAIGVVPVDYGFLQFGGGICGMRSAERFQSDLALTSGP